MEGQASRQEVKDATGAWIAGLVGWTHFLTLTHRLPGDQMLGCDRSTAARPDISPIASASTYGRPVVNAPSWTRVGMQRHRRMVRKFFYDVIRPRDPGSRWWSETEFHHSGQPHEHALLAIENPSIALLSIRQWWYEHCGYAVIEPIVGSGIVPAAYVAKYTEKSGAWPPLIYGFGLLPVPSFSRTLDLR